MEIDQVIKQNEGLAVKVAMQQAWACFYGITFDEMRQDGRIGLWRALQTFKPELGSFAGHAMSKIRATIQESIVKQPALRRVREGGRHRYKVRKFYSLDRQIGEDPSETFLDRVTDPRKREATTTPYASADPSFAQFFSDERRKIVVDAIMTVKMTDREREVLCRRFGFVGLCGAEDPDGQTQPEIGLEYGVTKERISQIEQSALRKLRNSTLFSSRLRDLYLP